MHLVAAIEVYENHNGSTQVIGAPGMNPSDVSRLRECVNFSSMKWRIFGFANPIFLPDAPTDLLKYGVPIEQIVKVEYGRSFGPKPI